VQPFIYPGAPVPAGEYLDQETGIQTYKYHYRGFDGEAYAVHKPLPGYEWVAEFVHPTWPDEFSLAFDDGPDRDRVLCSVKLTVDRLHWIMSGPDSIFEVKRPLDRRRELRWDLVHTFWGLMDRLQEDGTPISVQTVSRELARQCQVARRRYYQGLSTDVPSLDVKFVMCERFDRLPLDQRREVISGMVDAAYCHPHFYEQVHPDPRGFASSYGRRKGKKRAWGIMRKNPRRRRFAVVNEYRRSVRGQR